MGILLFTLGILTVAVIYIAGTYNKTVSFRNRMEEAWSGIDVAFKKRHDLTPVLVETVKGYAAHERRLFDDIARYRMQAMYAKGTEERIEPENGLGKALGRLMAVSENYPELKANANFLDLQRKLSEIEEQRPLARRYFNGTVREYNICLERFPSNLITGMFNFTKGTFFEIDKSERKAPVISFQ